jgi:putative phosphoesterase
MKITVLSDIHGNKAALDAVLRDTEAEKPDHIIVLGDIITDFPRDTKSVISTIRSITDFVIKGNREITINDNIEDGKSYKQFLTTYLTYRELSVNELNYLSTLPEQLSLQFDENLTLRCVHGSPSSAFEHIIENNDSKNSAMLDSITEKILLCGHTHKQWYSKLNGKTIINPGSVGINFSGSKAAQYAIMENGKDGLEIRLKNVAYDFDLFKSTCDLNIPWVRLCIRGIEDGSVYTMLFLEEAKKKYGLWPIPNELWDELFEEWCKKGII